MSSVEKTILELTKEKPQGKKETASAYFTRVAEAVSKLSDDDYAKLSVAAQNWFAQAAEALSENPEPEKIKPFSEFDGVNEPEETTTEKPEEEAPEPKEDAAQTTPKKKEGKKKDKKVAATTEKKEEKKETKKEEKKEEAAAAVTKPPKVKAPSVADTIRRAMCEDPSRSKDDVAKILKEKKMTFDQSRLDQVYSATAQVLEIIAELNQK